MYVFRLCGPTSTDKYIWITKQGLDKVNTYFKTWHLTLNPKKTTELAFHLNYKEAEWKLNLTVDGVPNVTQSTLSLNWTKIKGP